jgi:hypothetical protein
MGLCHGTRRTVCRVRAVCAFGGSRVPVLDVLRGKEEGVSIDSGAVGEAFDFFESDSVPILVTTGSGGRYNTLVTVTSLGADGDCGTLW